MFQIFMGEYYMKSLAIRLHGNDNVVTAKSDIDPNVSLNEENVITTQFIPVGHKIATKNINKGDDVVKYDNIMEHKNSLRITPLSEWNCMSLFGFQKQTDSKLFHQRILILLLYYF